MGHFNTGWFSSVGFGGYMVRIWSEYDESMGHFQAYDTQLSCFLVFPRVFFIFLIFLGRSADKFLQLADVLGFRSRWASAWRWTFNAWQQWCRRSRQLRSWSIWGLEIQGDPWSNGCPVPNGWFMEVSPCVSHISISDWTNDETWYAKQTPLFFQKRPSFFRRQGCDESRVPGGETACAKPVWLGQGSLWAALG